MQRFSVNFRRLPQQMHALSLLAQLLFLVVVIPACAAVRADRLIPRVTMIYGTLAVIGLVSVAINHRLSTSR